MQSDVTCRHMRAQSDECLVAALACANNTLAWRARRGIANLVKDEACPRILALWAVLRPQEDELCTLRCDLQAPDARQYDQNLLATLACLNNALFLSSCGYWHGHVLARTQRQGVEPSFATMEMSSTAFNPAGRPNGRNEKGILLAARQPARQLQAQ